MKSVHLTKTLPDVTKNTLPKICPNDLHSWLRYSFAKPVKSDVPTLILTLEYILSDFERTNIKSTYEVIFHYTTDADYNPMQLCQMFYKAIESAITDFKIIFLKEGFMKYPLQNISAPVFNNVFPLLKELYYPRNTDVN
jgi:hypothetical protein